MTNPLYIDNSTLRAVAECSTAALIKYLHGYTSTEERAELKAGTALHAALAAYFAVGKEPRRAALDAFADEYRAWAEENVASDHRLSYGNTSTILAAWLDAHPLGSLPFTMRYVEVGFAVPIADDIVLVGRMDGLAELRDGGLVVVEHKSTGNMSPWWLSQFRMAPQLTGYIVGAQEHVGGEKVVGALINAVEFSRLPSDPTRKCQKHATPYAECGPLHAKFQLIGPIQRTPEQVEEWRKTAVHLARRWQDLITRFPTLEDLHRVRMQGMFSGACRGCPAQDWCSVGRPLDRLDSMMTYDPWEPYPGATTRS